MRSPARRGCPTRAPASPCRRRPAPGARAPRPCVGARRVHVAGRRASCRDGRSRRTRTGTAWGRARRTRSSARPTRRSRASRPARPRGRSARRRCRARAVSLARTQPLSTRPSTSGQKPCAVAHADEVRVVHHHEREPTFERGQHALERDCSRSRPSERGSRGPLARR